MHKDTEVYGNSLYLLLNTAMDLKLLYKVNSVLKVAKTIPLIPYMPLCKVTLHLIPSGNRLRSPPLESGLALCFSVTNGMQQEVLVCAFQA